ncbi:MAG: prepilin-type N-terminal cleavage/methylation domain-containing protein [Terriglobia bacterium]
MGHSNWTCDLSPTLEGLSWLHSIHSCPARQRCSEVEPPLPAGQLTRTSAGFSLIETLVALTVLAFALLGLAMLFPAEERLAKLSGVTSETARLAQKELDQIRENISAPSGSFTDLDGNTVEVACPGTPGTSCGNPLTASGLIDFSQAAPVGFSTQLTDPSGQQYSIRWNISVTNSNGRKTVLAGKAVNLTGGLAPVVQFQTLTAP